LNILAPPAGPAPKTEQIKEEGVGQCYARPTTDDAELRWFAGAGEEPRYCDGGRLTLGQKLDSVWEGLLAAGAAGCPVCGGRMLRDGETGRCGSCVSSLS
jgi:hypothetical protein